MKKEYLFRLTLEQAEVINKLIGFKLSECMAWTPEEYKETIELSEYLNKQIGYFQGRRKDMEAEE